MITYIRLLLLTSFIISAYLGASSNDPVTWIKVKYATGKDKKKGPWKAYRAKSKDGTLASKVSFHSRSDQYKGCIKSRSGTQHLKKANAIAQFELLEALHDPTKTYEESSDEISDIE